MSDPRPDPVTMVAAFEPFGGRRRNRSWEVVRRLPPRPGLVCAKLPVDFARLPAEISALLARRPAALLLVGEARRPVVSVEQLALNIADSDRSDNAGAVLHDRPLATGSAAPLAVRASWDARAVADLLCRANIPAEASFHAGTYACNASLYLALQQARSATPGTAVGFLHVPQARWPRGPRLQTLMAAVQIAAQALGLASSPA